MSKLGWVLAALVLTASPGGVWAKSSETVVLGTLEMAEANASSEGPLGPEDFITARLDYSISELYRHSSFGQLEEDSELEIQAQVWAVKPFTMQLLPVEISPQQKLSRFSGAVDVVVRLQQAFERENVAHPLRLTFALTHRKSETRSTIIATSGRLELETQTQRLAWRDPVRMAELAASGEPIPYSNDLGLNPPELIEGKLPRKLRGASKTWKVQLTIDAEGAVQDVDPLGATTDEITPEAIEALKALRYRPASYEDQPVAVLYTL
ncbi:MAG: hypothetical protein AAF560_32160 [Acidobacteriota bacterium]